MRGTTETMVHQKMIIFSLLMSVVCCEDSSLTAEHATCPSNVTARDMLSEIMESSSFYFITESALLDLASTNETVREILFHHKHSENLRAFDFPLCRLFSKSNLSCVYEKSIMLVREDLWPYFEGGSPESPLPVCGIGYGDSGCGSYKHLVSPCGNITSIENEPTPRFKKFPSQGKNCEWIITVDVGYVIELTFEYFWTDDCLESCECDYLKIFDVFVDIVTERGKFCGVYSKWTFISNSNKVKLAYHLQGYESGTGFNIVYRGITNSSVKILSAIQHVSGLNGSIELKNSQPTIQVGNLLFYAWVLRTEEYRKLVVQWKVTDACESGIQIEMYDGPSSDHTIIANVTTKEDISGTTEGSGFQIHIEAAKHKNCLADFNATFSSEEKNISFYSKKNHRFWGLKLGSNEQKTLNIKTSTEKRNIYEGFVMKAPVGLYVSLDIRKFVFQGSNQDDCAEEGMVLWDGLPGEGTKYGPYCNNLISLWLFSVPFRIRRGMGDRSYAPVDTRKTNQTAIIHSSTNVFTVLFYWYFSAHAEPTDLQIIAEVSDCVGIFDDFYNIKNRILKNVEYSYDDYSNINIYPEPNTCFVIQALPSTKIPMKVNSTVVTLYTEGNRFMVSNLIVSDPDLSVCKGDNDFKFYFRYFVVIDRQLDCAISPFGFIVKLSTREKPDDACINETVVVDVDISGFRGTRHSKRIVDAFCGDIFVTYPYQVLKMPQYQLNLLAPNDKIMSHHYVFYFSTINTYMDFRMRFMESAFVIGSPVWFNLKDEPFHWKSMWSRTIIFNFHVQYPATLQINFRLVPDTYPLSDPGVVCPQNHTSRLYGYKGYCYEVVPFGFRSKKLNWKEAEEACYENGGTLLTINTKEELLYIKNLFKHHYKSSLRYSGIFYIGLVTDGKGHRWIDGNPGVVTEWYRKFPMKLQPLTAQFFGNEGNFASPNIDQPVNNAITRCTAMANSNPYMSTNWFKTPCHYPNNAGYICKYKGSGGKTEYRVSQNITKHTQIRRNSNATVLSAGTIDCPIDWVYYGDKCYKLLSSTSPINTAFTCTDASETCFKHSGYLATVSQSVFSHVRYLLDVFKHEPVYGAIWVSGCKIIHAEEPDKYTFFKYFTLLNNSTNVTKILNVLCETNPYTKVHKCKKGQFTCEDGTCILNHHLCDGQKDCISGDDELHCHPSGSNFLCEDGSVIPFSKYCDFESDCRDNSDEKNCTRATCSPTELQCENGECLPSNRFSDKIEDCLDGSDEKQKGNIKVRSDFFRCNNGDSIPKKFVNNQRADCEGNIQEDEFFIDWEAKRGIWYDKNYTYNVNFAPYCPNENGSHVRCNKEGIYCFPRHKVCIYETDKYGYMGGCSDGSHLVDCEKFQCPSLFKCPQSYCIPLHKVCDGVVDCTGGADEAECAALSCPGLFKCRKEGYCIDQSLVCDGIYHCRDSHEDEIFCEFDCPLGCTCVGHSVNGSFNGYTRIPFFSFKIRSLVLTGNKIEFNNSTSLPYQYLGQLILNKNKMRYLPKGVFMHLINLLTLDLEDNRLEHLSNGMFHGLNKLQHLYLYGNPLHKLGQASFSGLKTIHVLDLNNLSLKVLDVKSFAEMPSMKYLSLANNNIESLNSTVFYGVSSIKKLNLEGNDIFDVETETFQGIEKLEELNTDDFKFCCLAKHASVCTPRGDAFSSCEDLMANNVLQVLIWVTGFSALLGNIFIVAWRAFTQDNSTHAILIMNLGLSDFLMGVYLIIIASADQFYRGKYILFADYWKNSHLCKFAGFLSTVSSQMSVYTLVVITADRLVNIVFPFAGKKLSFRNAVIICVFGWIIFIVLSFLPLINLAYFGDNFVKHGVCLLFNVSAGKHQGWEYITFLFLLFNILSFTFIFVSYILMYFNLDKSRQKVKREVSSGEIAMMKRFILIVITDFICWIPLIFTAFLAQSGTPVNPVVSVWLAVLILPINSALNPYLYTLSTLSQMKQRSKQKGK